MRKLPQQGCFVFNLVPARFRCQQSEKTHLLLKRKIKLLIHCPFWIYCASLLQSREQGSGFRDNGSDSEMVLHFRRRKHLSGSGVRQVDFASTEGEATKWRSWSAKKKIKWNKNKKPRKYRLMAEHSWRKTDNGSSCDNFMCWPRNWYVNFWFLDDVNTELKISQIECESGLTFPSAGQRVCKDIDIDSTNWCWKFMSCKRSNSWTCVWGKRHFFVRMFAQTLQKDNVDGLPGTKNERNDETWRHNPWVKWLTTICRLFPEKRRATCAGHEQLWALISCAISSSRTKLPTSTQNLNYTSVHRIQMSQTRCLDLADHLITTELWNAIKKRIGRPSGAWTVIYFANWIVSTDLSPRGKDPVSFLNWMLNIHPVKRSVLPPLWLSPLGGAAIWRQIRRDFASPTKLDLLKKKKKTFVGKCFWVVLISLKKKE